MKILFSVAILCMVTFSFADEQNNKKIKELLSVTNAVAMGVQVANQIYSETKKLFPQVPEKVWNEMLSEMHSDEYAELIVKLYDKHFNEAEIDAMLSLYSTEEGKNIIKKMPLFLQESFKVGQLWGEQKA